MRLTIAFLILLTSITAAQTSLGPNPFNVPSTGFAPITAGQPTTLSWKPTTSGTVSLQLRSGANSNLDQGTTIASSIPNTGTYTYTPPADTVRGSSYTIEITDDGDKSQVNYTPQFVIDSKNTVASISSASLSSGATTASVTRVSTPGTAIGTSASSVSVTTSTGTAAHNTASSSVSSGSAMKTNTGTRGSTSASATATTTSTAKSGAARMELDLWPGMAMVITGVAITVAAVMW